MSDTSDIPIQGKISKRFRVLWKGHVIANFDTEEELEAERTNYEKVIAGLVGRGSKQADRRYQIFDGNKLIHTAELQSNLDD